MGRKKSCHTKGSLRNAGGCNESTWCNANMECESGYCETGGSQTWAGSGGGICRLAERGNLPIDGIKAKGGEWCDDNFHCSSNVCQIDSREGCASEDNIVLPENSDKRASCTKKGALRNSTTDGCPSFTFCSSDSQCDSGYCENGGSQTWAGSGGGICRVAPRGVVSPKQSITKEGNWCDDDKHCPVGWTCLLKSRQGCCDPNNKPCDDIAPTGIEEVAKVANTIRNQALEIVFFPLNILATMFETLPSQSNILIGVFILLIALVIVKKLLQ